MGTISRSSELVNVATAKGRKNETFEKTSDNTYRTVESAELVIKTSGFFGCHEQDVNSLTWPL